MQRRTFCQLMAAAGLALSRTAMAQGDAESLEILVPFPAGGASDAFARTLSPGLSRQLKRNVIVDNLSGASGSLAAAKVLDHAAAGDMLMLASPTELILAPAMVASARYKPSDFRLLGLISKVPLAFYVRADLPVKSIDELVAYARSQRDKPLTYGSVGIGSVYHLATESFAAAAGIQLIHVPYRGGTPLRQDLLGGRIDFVMFPADGSQLKQLATGKVRVIGVTGSVRAPAFPDVPTMAESRSLASFTTVDIWGGLFAPAATPDAVVQALHRATQAALLEPQLRKTMEGVAGTTLAPAMSLAELARFYADETARYQAATKLVKLEKN